MDFRFFFLLLMASYFGFGPNINNFIRGVGRKKEWVPHYRKRSYDSNQQTLGKIMKHLSSKLLEDEDFKSFAVGSKNDDAESQMKLNNGYLRGSNDVLDYYDFDFDEGIRNINEIKKFLTEYQENLMRKHLQMAKQSDERSNFSSLVTSSNKNKETVGDVYSMDQAFHETKTVVSEDGYGLDKYIGINRSSKTDEKTESYIDDINQTSNVTNYVLSDVSTALVEDNVVKSSPDKIWNFLNEYETISEHETVASSYPPLNFPSLLTAPSTKYEELLKNQIKEPETSIFQTDSSFDTSKTTTQKTLERTFSEPIKLPKEKQKLSSTEKITTKQIRMQNENVFSSSFDSELTSEENTNDKSTENYSETTEKSPKAFSGTEENDARETKSMENYITREKYNNTESYDETKYHYNKPIAVSKTEISGAIDAGMSTYLRQKSEVSFTERTFPTEKEDKSESAYNDLKKFTSRSSFDLDLTSVENTNDKSTENYSETTEESPKAFSETEENDSRESKSGMETYITAEKYNNTESYDKSIDQYNKQIAASRTDSGSIDASMSTHLRHKSEINVTEKTFSFEEEGKRESAYNFSNNNSHSGRTGLEIQTFYIFKAKAGDKAHIDKKLALTFTFENKSESSNILLSTDQTDLELSGKVQNNYRHKEDIIIVPTVKNIISGFELEKIIPESHKPNIIIFEKITTFGPNTSNKEYESPDTLNSTHIYSYISTQYVKETARQEIPESSPKLNPTYDAELQKEIENNYSEKLLDESDIGIEKNSGSTTNGNFILKVKEASTEREFFKDSTISQMSAIYESTGSTFYENPGELRDSEYSQNLISNHDNILSSWDLGNELSTHRKASADETDENISNGEISAINLFKTPKNLMNIMGTNTTPFSVSMVPKYVYLDNSNITVATSFENTSDISYNYITDFSVENVTMNTKKGNLVNRMKLHASTPNLTTGTPSPNFTLLRAASNGEYQNLYKNKTNENGNIYFYTSNRMKDVTELNSWITTSRAEKKDFENLSEQSRVLPLAKHKSGVNDTHNLLIKNLTWRLHSSINYTDSGHKEEMNMTDLKKMYRKLRSLYIDMKELEQVMKFQLNLLKSMHGQMRDHGNQVLNNIEHNKSPEILVEKHNIFDPFSSNLQYRSKRFVHLPNKNNTNAISHKDKNVNLKNNKLNLKVLVTDMTIRSNSYDNRINNYYTELKLDDDDSLSNKKSEAGKDIDEKRLPENEKSFETLKENFQKIRKILSERKFLSQQSHGMPVSKDIEAPELIPINNTKSSSKSMTRVPRQQMSFDYNIPNHVLSGKPLKPRSRYSCHFRNICGRRERSQKFNFSNYSVGKKNSEPEKDVDEKQLPENKESFETVKEKFQTFRTILSGRKFHSEQSHGTPVSKDIETPVFPPVNNIKSSSKNMTPVPKLQMPFDYNSTNHVISNKKLISRRHYGGRLVNTTKEGAYEKFNFSN